MADMSGVSGGNDRHVRHYELDSHGHVWVAGARIGYVGRNRWSKSYSVWQPGQTQPMSFPGRNSAFATREAAADALVAEVSSL